MNNSRIPWRLVWGVDPLTLNSSPHKSAERFLEKLRQEFPCELEPVYVHSRINFFFQHRRFNQHAMGGLDEADLKSALRRWARNLGWEQVQKPKFLLAHGSRLASLSKVLNEYATNTHKDGIVVASSSPSPFYRLLFGSFAESLIKEARVPVITLTSRLVSRGNGSILFVTQLERGFARSLRSVLSIAQALRSPVVLLHHREGITSLHPPMKGSERPAIIIRRGLRRILKLAEEHGIRLTYKIKEDGETLAETILQEEQTQEARVIGLSHVPEWMETTRQLLKTSHCPLWHVPQTWMRRESEPLFAQSPEKRAV